MSHIEPYQHFFEPHEIADLKDAFKVDEAAELKYLESKTFLSVSFLMSNYSYYLKYNLDLELDQLEGIEVIKYSTHRYLGTQIITYDEEKPLSLILNASASSFDIEEVLKLMGESVNFPYRANVDAWAITISGNSEKSERRLIYPNQWYDLKIIH